MRIAGAAGAECVGMRIAGADGAERITGADRITGAGATG